MIILYGGSFNPPTIAHYKIAHYLINKYQPKRFIFIPVGNNYNKSELIPFQNRFEMVKIMINNLPHTSVTDYENHFKHFSGTIDTLKHFQSLYPQDVIYYVVGADNILTIKQWIDYKTLLNDFKFIIINRNHVNLEAFINQDDVLKTYKNNLIIEKKIKNIDVSSTQYRKKNNDDMVSKEINQYIYTHNLYHRGEKNEK